MTDRGHVKEAFAAYAALYNAEDPKIKLKIGHTYRVASLAERIARSIGIEDTDLIWLCGMLHDIGRFEQVRRYGTFSDAASVDHASFGADLLFKEGLLDSFCGLDEKERELLELAIRSHSLYRLPDGLSEEETAVCNILRDADKVDIFRVNVEIPTEDIYNVSTYELKHSLISPEVKQCFLDRHAVLRSLKKTPADFIVGHACLTFELVYPKSREEAKEQGFVDRLISFESEEEETRKFFEYMRANIWG